MCEVRVRNIKISPVQLVKTRHRNPKTHADSQRGIPETKQSSKTRKYRYKKKKAMLNCYVISIYQYDTDC